MDENISDNEKDELHKSISFSREDYEPAEIDDISMLDEAPEAAKKGFKVKYLFPWQRLVIANILDSAREVEADPEFQSHGDDADFCRGRQIVLLPTGAGKSMCFLVPAMILKGPTLILYPLLALMADQKRRMEEAGIPCVIFKGGQTKEEREENFRLLFEEDETKRAKVIIANPEVLQNEELVNKLSETKIAHIALDEAHCVSEWGDSFRPAYLTLGKIIKALKCPIVTAFTATASPPVLNRIGEVLFDGLYHLIQSPGDRPNIHYAVKYAYAKKKAVLECAKTMKKPMIVFCGTRNRAEDMARLLDDYFQDGNVKFYHAGMTKEEKLAVEKWFFESDSCIICATCALGMGMDKGNIYSVVHLDAPAHIEDFVQEAGRGGRKGDDVNSVLIWNHADYVRWRQSPPESRERAMGDMALNTSCRRSFMLKYLGGEEAVCSGCDICDARQSGKKLSYKAWDAEMAVKLIRRNRRLFTREEAVQVLTERFNRLKLPLFGIDVWEAKDTSEILSQLLSERRIKICGWLWENHLDVTGWDKQNIVLKLIPRRLRHHLHRLRFLLRQGLERLQRLA